MTWWRNLGGLLAACVLALLVVAPTVSMATCLCQDEVAIVSVETSMATVQAVQTDQQDHVAPCDAACCVSGHCHHGGVMLDTAIAGVPTPAPVVSEHAMTSAHALSSRTISGPDRPPRA
jgi:hypothetical protein